MSNVKPHHVYVGATIDQGKSVVDACEVLGLQTLGCRGHLSTAVTWATRLVGNEKRCKHPDIKALIRKFTALVVVSVAQPSTLTRRASPTKT